MRKSLISMVVAPLGLCLSSAAASAEEQAPSCSALLAPASLSLRDTGLDSPRVACGATGYGAGTRAFALVDTPNFYGSLSASLLVDYRYLTSTGFELGVGARLLDYRFTQTAVFTTADLTLGPVHVDVVRPARSNWWGKPLVLSHALRVEIPRSNLSDDNIVVALSPSIMSSMFVSPAVHWHSRAAALLWTALPDSGPDGRAALIVSSDLAYSPLSFASLLVGTEVQGGWYGLGLDHLQVRGGLRIATGEFGAVELSAGTAIAGEERADLIGWIGYRSLRAAPPKKKRSRLHDWAK